MNADKSGSLRRAAVVVAAVVLLVPAVLLTVTACAQSPAHTPRLDAKFGEAVRQARARQTIDPEASKNTDPVSGIDGVAAQNSIEEYQKSFQEPPQTFNVLGIGGGAGAGSP